jgi:hypothetical protein
VRRLALLEVGQLEETAATNEFAARKLHKVEAIY